MTHHIGRIVAGCLTAGPVVALGLVLGPMAGAQEPVITGTVLLAFASSWALLALLSIRMTDQPQPWAALPAVFMGLAGAALLALAPGGTTIGALGWVWPPLLLVAVAKTAAGVQRDLRGRSRSWIVYPLLGAYALCALGGWYQTLQDSLDRRTHAPSGQLVDIGGRRLHLMCAGSGRPTVILESGLGETAAYWALISAAVAQDTRVCAYDRAGRGWSDPPPVPQDGVAAATDLHQLLKGGDVRGPFVLVGHSSGAQYVRIFGGRYPEQVAGMVLLDGQPAEAFERLPAFPAFYDRFRRVVALLPSLARLGVGRLIYREYTGSLPANARSLRDEFAELPTALAQARSFQSLGNRPLVVVTAAVGAQTGWLPLQEEMAALSTNSSHRVVNATHDALITERDAARTSAQAIRDVVRAVRFASTLNQ